MIIFALMMTMLIASLDQSIVNTALPRMASDLGGLEHISWVVTSFLLCMTISAPLYGKLSDMYGRRRVLVTSICISLTASIICGFSQNMMQLVIARGLQGLGAGGLLVLVQTIIADLVPARERGRYVGITTGAMTVGNLAGPVIGGWLTQTFSWRLVFFVNIPVGIFALAMILIALKGAEKHHRHKVDYLGAGLLSVGAICAMLLLSWAGSIIDIFSREALALLAGAALGFASFYWWEKRATEPLVDFTLFKTPDLLVASLTSGLINFSMQGMLVFIPLYLQLVVGLSPFHAGLCTLPQIFMLLLSSLVFGPVSSRYGRPKVTLIGGTLVQIVAIAAIVACSATGAPLFWFIASLTIFGLGQGVAMPSATLIVQAVSDAPRLGMATSAIAFIRSLGGTTGLAVSGGVMTGMLAGSLARLPVDPDQISEGGLKAIDGLTQVLRLEVIDAYRYAITATFSVSLAIMVLAILIGSRVRDRVLSSSH